MTPFEKAVEAEVARAICRVCLNGGDPNQRAIRWNGTDMEEQSFPAWKDYLDEARAAIAAYRAMLTSRPKAQQEGE